MEVAAGGPAGGGGGPDGGVDGGDAWLYGGESPRWWLDANRRAGAYVRGKALALRLRDVFDAGDTATFEALLRLPVAAIVKGRRSKFVGTLYRYSFDIGDAALAACDRLPLQDDVLGGELGFWHALLDLQDLAAVKSLVDRGLDLRPLQLDAGINALTQAVDWLSDDHVALIEYLVGLGCFDLEQKSRRGYTPFGWAVVSRNLATARVLWAAGCSVNITRDQNADRVAECVAGWITEEPHMAVVLREELGMELGLLGSVSEGTTVLQYLAVGGRTLGVDAFFAAGGGVTVGDVEGAIALACNHGHESTALLLLDSWSRGLDPILQLLDWEGLPDEKWTKPTTPLLAALEGGQLGLARTLLQRGTDPCIVPPGRTASYLFYGLIHRGNVEGLQFLVDEAGITELDLREETVLDGTEGIPKLSPLFHAVFNGHLRQLEVATFLLSRGANPSGIPAAYRLNDGTPDIFKGALDRVEEIDRLRWLIRARSCHDTTTALAAQLSSLNFDVAEPSGFASACKAAAAATEGGNIVIGRRLVDGRRLPAVTMRAEEDEEEGSGIGGIGVGAAPPLSAFERERLRAVLGFVVQGGLLPELFGELKEMMWQVWWDDWRAAATAAQEEGQAEQGEGGEQVQGEGAGEDA